MRTSDPNITGPLAEFILRQNFVEAAIHGDLLALDDAIDTYDINVNWARTRTGMPS